MKNTLLYGLALALFGAMPAGAAVPGFAGNITGGGNATPVVVSTLSAAQTAVNFGDAKVDQ